MDQFLVFLQKSPFNMLLLGLAVSSGAMLLWPLLSRPFRATHEIGAFEAVQLINRRDALVLDVRDTAITRRDISPAQSTCPRRNWPIA